MKKQNIFVRSLRELRNPRALVVTAMLIALNLAMDMAGIRFYITPEVRVSPGFLCNASVGMLYGPTVGMMTGFLTDVLGFLFDHSGMGYFPGYTITAIVGGLIYGLWLYPGKPTRLRVLGAKACINLFCNIGLNTVWSSMLYGSAISAILPARIVKNLLLLPVEVIALYLVANIVLTQFHRVFPHSVRS